jgi:TonB family protein
VAVQTWHGERGKNSHHVRHWGEGWFSCRVEKALPMDQTLAPFLGKGNVIKAPMPMYPSPWTRKEGRGVYEIHVNNAGVVTEVKILKPSGDSTFDGVTVDTLREWRLRNGPKLIELPLVFVLTPDNFRVWIP